MVGNNRIKNTSVLYTRYLFLFVLIYILNEIMHISVCKRLQLFTNGTLVHRVQPNLWFAVHFSYSNQLIYVRQIKKDRYNLGIELKPIH